MQFVHLEVLVFMAHPDGEVVHEWHVRVPAFGR